MEKKLKMNRNYRNPLMVSDILPKQDYEDQGYNEKVKCKLTSQYCTPTKCQFPIPHCFQDIISTRFLKSQGHYREVKSRSCHDVNSSFGFLFEYNPKFLIMRNKILQQVNFHFDRAIVIVFWNLD